MQVFKVFFRITRKQLNSIIVYLVVFLGIAIAMGQMGSGNAISSFETTSLNIVVSNEDSGELGDALVDYLDQTNEIKKLPDTEDELLDGMYTRDIDYVMYIPDDFTEEITAGNREELIRIRKVPSSVYGALADNQIETYMKMVESYLDGGFELGEAISQAKETLDNKADVKLAEGEVKLEKGMPEYYFQYIPYVTICCMIMLLGPVLIAFRKKDISARNKCSATSSLAQNVQQILGSILVTFGILAVLLAAVLVMAPDYVLSVKGVFSMINAAITSLFAMAITFMVTQLVRNTKALDMMSNGIGLALAFLGGIFVPLDIFDKSVLQISRFMPTYWYVQVNDAIMEITDWEHVPSIVMQGYGIQLLFVGAVLCVGLVINRMKVQVA